MLRLFSSKAKGCKDFFENHPNPVMLNIHWIALVEYSQMSTLVPGFQSFIRVFLHHFIMAKLATSRIRVNWLEERKERRNRFLRRF